MVQEGHAGRDPGAAGRSRNAGLDLREDALRPGGAKALRGRRGSEGSRRKKCAGGVEAAATRARSLTQQCEGDPEAASHRGRPSGGMVATIELVKDKDAGPSVGQQEKRLESLAAPPHNDGGIGGAKGLLGKPAGTPQKQDEESKELRVAPAWFYMYGGDHRQWREVCAGLKEDGFEMRDAAGVKKQLGKVREQKGEKPHGEAPPGKPYY